MMISGQKQSMLSLAWLKSTKVVFGWIEQSISVVSQLEWASESPGGLAKTQISGAPL